MSEQEDIKHRRYTKQTQQRVVSALMVGGTIVEACIAAGIATNTYYHWLKEIPAFAEAVESVKAKQVLTWLSRIEAASTTGDWHAAAWKLEHIYPERFSKSRVEVTGKDGGPIAISDTRARLTEKLRRFAERRRTESVDR